MGLQLAGCATKPITLLLSLGLGNIKINGKLNIKLSMEIELLILDKLSSPVGVWILGLQFRLFYIGILHQ